jgi:uncharacterized membrane protein YbhN (UPF0104 family)
MAERAKTWRRVLGLVLGIVLVAAAIWYAAARVDFKLIQQAKPWQLAAIAGGVVLNLLVTSLLFWAVTIPFKPNPPVSYRKMLALISASGLLNYLPLQAGTVGRSAFLVTRHGLSPVNVITMILIVIGLTFVVAIPCLLLNGFLSVGVPIAFVVAVSAVALVAGALAVERVLRPHGRGIGWIALLIKLADLAVTSGRLWIAFRVCGHPVSAIDAMIAAAAASLASLVSPIPAGLGLREWAVALTQGPYGVLATLVDRAIEAVVLIVAGILGIVNLKSDKPAKPQAA